MEPEESLYILLSFVHSNASDKLTTWAGHEKFGCNNSKLYLLVAPYKPLLRKCKENLMTVLKLKSQRKEGLKEGEHKGMIEIQGKFLDNFSMNA